MIVCEAVKDEMTGVPLQAVGADVFVALACPSTLILTVTIVPNSTPLALRRRQVPLCAPGAVGAVIATNRSAVAPLAVFGTGIALVVDIASPLAKTS